MFQSKPAAASSIWLAPTEQLCGLPIYAQRGDLSNHYRLAAKWGEEVAAGRLSFKKARRIAACSRGITPIGTISRRQSRIRSTFVCAGG